MQPINVVLTNSYKHSDVVLPQKQLKSTKIGPSSSFLLLEIVYGMHLITFLMTKINLLLHMKVRFPNKFNGTAKTLFFSLKENLDHRNSYHCILFEASINR